MPTGLLMLPMGKSLAPARILCHLVPACADACDVISKGGNEGPP